MEAVRYPVTLNERSRLRFLAAALTAFANLSTPPRVVALLVSLNNDATPVSDGKLLYPSIVSERLRQAHRDREFIVDVARKNRTRGSCKTRARSHADEETRVRPVETIDNYNNSNNNTEAEGSTDISMLDTTLPRRGERSEDTTPGKNLSLASQSQSSKPTSSAVKPKGPSLAQEVSRLLSKRAAGIEIWVVAYVTPCNAKEIGQVCAWQKYRVQIQEDFLRADSGVESDRQQRKAADQSAAAHSALKENLKIAPLVFADAIAVSFRRCPNLLAQPSNAAATLEPLLGMLSTEPVMRQGAKARRRAGDRRALTVKEGPSLLMLDVTCCVDVRPQSDPSARGKLAKKQRRGFHDTLQQESLNQVLPPLPLDPATITIPPKKLPRGAHSANVVFFIAYDAWLSRVDGVPSYDSSSGFRVVSTSVGKDGKRSSEKQLKEEEDAWLTELDAAGGADPHCFGYVHRLFSRLSNGLFRQTPLRICCGYGGSLERLVQYTGSGESGAAQEQRASTMSTSSVVLRSSRDVYALLSVLLGGDDRTDLFAEACSAVSSARKRMERRGTLSSLGMTPRRSPNESSNNSNNNNESVGLGILRTMLADQQEKKDKKREFLKQQRRAQNGSEEANDVRRAARKRMREADDGALAWTEES